MTIFIDNETSAEIDRIAGNMCDKYRLLLIIHDANRKAEIKLILRQAIINGITVAKGHKSDKPEFQEMKGGRP